MEMVGMMYCIIIAVVYLTLGGSGWEGEGKRTNSGRRPFRFDPLTFWPLESGLWYPLALSHCRYPLYPVYYRSQGSAFA